MPKTHKTSDLTIKSNIFKQKNAWSTRFWWKLKISIFAVQIENHCSLYCDQVSVRLISGGRVTYPFVFSRSFFDCFLIKNPFPFFFVNIWRRNCIMWRVFDWDVRWLLAGWMWGHWLWDVEELCSSGSWNKSDWTGEEEKQTVCECVCVCYACVCVACVCVACVCVCMHVCVCSVCVCVCTFVHS